MTQRSTMQTNLWLRGQDRSNTRSWYRKCQMLARTARNVGAMYPSAISSAHATPAKYRVYKPKNIQRGMVAYFDDPHDSNPYGHIVTVQGRDKHGHLLCWTNDVVGPGMVSLTPMAYFPAHWGDRLLFAASWLNGVQLDLPERGGADWGPIPQDRLPELKEDPGPPESLGRAGLEKAQESLTKAIKETKDDRVKKALKRDRKVLEGALRG